MKRPKTSQRIAGQFAPRTIEMLRSPAMRALSLTGRRILDRIEIELADHGGRDNGHLPVTYSDLTEFGIGNRHLISPGIRELIALGFLELTKRGRAGNGGYRTPNVFRITYLRAGRAAPTHEWRRIKTIVEAELIARESRRASPRKNTRPKKQSPVPKTSTGPVPKMTPNTSAQNQH